MTDKKEKTYKEKLQMAVWITFSWVFICWMLTFSVRLYHIPQWGFFIGIGVLFMEMVLWRVRLGATRGFKWLLTFFLSLILLLILCVGTILSALTGDIDFYFPFLLVYTVLLIGWLIGWCCVVQLPRWMKFALLLLLFSAPLFPAGYAYQKYQKNKIPRLREDFDLTAYAPFTHSALLARLEEEATLQLEPPLPVMHGATALYPLYAAFAEATYPEYLTENDSIRYVWGGSTPRAFESLLTGEADIIFCAQPSREQWEEVREKGNTFLLTPIGKEAFVFFVHKDNPVVSLSSRDIRDIYSGKTTHWKEIGGKNKKILPFQRPAGSGSQTMLEHIMGEVPLMPAPENKEVMGMGEIIDLTSTYRNSQNALGYSFLFFTQKMVANQTIRLLEIDGIAPHKENIMNGTYPFTIDFYAITLSQPSENVQKLIGWIVSDQEQQLVEQTGYVKRLTI
ncbi:MAG: substrate-binding domain-containing protein [Bacteroides sp.]|nr:substrate-binding domain-containing protein [Bacteroides sp.]